MCTDQSFFRSIEGNVNNRFTLPYDNSRYIPIFAKYLRGEYIKPKIRYHYIRTSTRGYIHCGEHVNVLTYYTASGYKNVKLYVSKSELDIDSLIDHPAAVHFSKITVDGVNYYTRSMGLYSLLDLVMIYKTDINEFGRITGLPVDRCPKFRCGHDYCFSIDRLRYKYFIGTIKSALDFAQHVSNYCTFSLVPDNVCIGDNCVYDWGDYIKGSCNAGIAVAPFMYFLEAHETILGLHVPLLSGSDRMSYDDFLSFYMYPIRLNIPKELLTREPGPIDNLRGDKQIVLALRESVRYYISLRYDRWLSTYDLFRHEIMPGFGRQPYRAPEFESDSLLAAYSKVISYKYLKSLIIDGFSFDNACYHTEVHPTIETSCFECKTLVEMLEDAPTNGYSNLLTIGRSDSLPRSNSAAVSGGEYFLDNELVDKFESNYWFSEDGDSYRFKILQNCMNIVDDNDLVSTYLPRLPFPLSGAKVQGSLDDVKHDLSLYNMNDPICITLSEFVLQIKYQFHMFTRINPLPHYTTIPADSVKTGLRKKSGGAIIGQVANAGGARVALSDGYDDYGSMLDDYCSKYDNSMYFTGSVAGPKVAIQPQEKRLRSIISGNVLSTDAMRTITQYFHKLLASVPHVFIGDRADIMGWTHMLKVLDIPNITHKMSLDHSKFDRKVDSAFQSTAMYLLLGLLDGPDTLQRRHNILGSTLCSNVYNILMHDGNVYFKNGGVSSGQPITAFNNTLAAQANMLIAYARSVLDVQYEQKCDTVYSRYQAKMFDCLMENPDINNFNDIAFIDDYYVQAGLSDDVVCSLNESIVKPEDVASRFNDFNYSMPLNDKCYICPASEPVTELMSRWSEKAPILYSGERLILPSPKLDRVICSAILLNKAHNLDATVRVARLLSIILDAFPLLYSNQVMHVANIGFKPRQFILFLIDYLNEVRSGIDEIVLNSPELVSYLEDSNSQQYVVDLLNQKHYTVESFAAYILPTNTELCEMPLSACCTAFSIPVFRCDIFNVIKGGDIVVLAVSSRTDTNFHKRFYAFTKGRNSRRGTHNLVECVTSTGIAYVIYLAFRRNLTCDYNSRHMDIPTTRSFILGKLLSEITPVVRQHHKQNSKIFIPYYSDISSTRSMYVALSGFGNVHIFTSSDKPMVQFPLYDPLDCDNDNLESSNEGLRNYCFYCDTPVLAVYQCVKCVSYGLHIYCCSKHEHWRTHELLGHDRWYNFTGSTANIVSCVKCKKPVSLDEGVVRGHLRACSDCADKKLPPASSYNFGNTFAHALLGITNNEPVFQYTSKFHSEFVKLLDTAARVSAYLYWISENGPTTPATIVEVDETNDGFIISANIDYQRSAHYTINGSISFPIEQLYYDFGKGLELSYRIAKGKVSNISIGDSIIMVPNKTMISLLDNISYSEDVIKSMCGNRPIFGRILTLSKLRSIYPMYGDLISSIETNYITCVQGVAGAGKSRFIRNLLYEELNNLGVTVIACQSHDAVDCLGNTLVNLNNKVKIVFRVVPKKDFIVNTKLPPYSPANKGLVFLTTLNSIRQLSGYKSVTLIIDEASQMHDASYVSAISVLKPARVIFFGDPQQIPAVLPVKAEPANVNVYTRSSSTKVHRLTASYRFGPTLALYLSEWYGFTLTSNKKTDTTVQALAYTHTAEVVSEDTYGFVYFIKLLLASYPGRSILVVTPYNAYVTLYKIALTKACIDIEVSTVYRSQGAEADIVVYIPVIKGLQDKLDVNYIHIVAFSRARESLYILSDSKRFDKIRVTLNIKDLFVGYYNQPRVSSLNNVDVSQPLGWHDNTLLVNSAKDLPIINWPAGKIVYPSVDSNEGMVLDTAPVHGNYLNTYTIEEVVPIHPRQGAIFLDVEAVPMRFIKHYNAKGELKTTQGFCEIAMRISTNTFVKQFRPGVWSSSTGFSSYADGVFVRRHMFGDKAASDALYARISKARITYEDVCKLVITFIHKNVNGQPVFYVKSHRLDLAALAPILSNGSLSCSYQSCDSPAYFANIDRSAFCAQHINEPVFLCNFKVVDIDRFYGQESLSSLHSKYCGIDHGSAHTALADILMTECLSVRLQRNRVIYPGVHCKSSKCLPWLGVNMRVIKSLFEDAPPSVGYIGGGRVIGNKPNNIDKLYNRDFYKHLPDCNHEAHVYLDCYVDETCDPGPKYLVRCDFGSCVSWYKGMYETRFSKYIYIDSKYNKYPHYIKFPTACDGELLPYSGKLNVHYCRGGLICAHHFSKLSKLSDVIDTLASYGVKLDDDLTICYLHGSSNLENYLLNTSTSSPVPATYPPMTLKGYTVDKLRNDTRDKALTIVHLLKSIDRDLGKIAVLGAASGKGTTPMSDFFLENGASTVLSIDPREMGMQSNRHAKFHGDLSDYKSVKMFDNIVSDIYDVGMPTDTFSRIVEFIFMHLNIGGSCFIKVTIGSQDPVLNILIKYFSYVHFHKAIKRNNSVTSELWLVAHNYQPNTLYERGDILHLYNGQLHFLNKHPHKHAMLPLLL